MKIYNREKGANVAESRIFTRTEDELDADGCGVRVECLYVQGRESLDEALPRVSIYFVAHGVESVDWHLWTRRLGGVRWGEKGRSDAPLNNILDHLELPQIRHLTAVF